MAIIKKELPLVFQYIQISSPIPFYIYGSDNEKAKRLLPSNAYVLRSAELLTSEKAPNQPIWKVYIEYDDTLLTDGRIVEVNGFNVDFSKYLETFGGQLVRFGDDQLEGLYTVINTPAWVADLRALSTVIQSTSFPLTFKTSLQPNSNEPAVGDVFQGVVQVPQNSTIYIDTYDGKGQSQSITGPCMLLGKFFVQQKPRQHTGTLFALDNEVVGVTGTGKKSGIYRVYCDTNSTIYYIGVITHIK